jgi:hypothetical protein
MYSYNPKQPGSRPFEKIVSFQVKISNVRAEDVTVRHAGLHEKQKIKCIFDDKKFKSDLVRPGIEETNTFFCLNKKFPESWSFQCKRSLLGSCETAESIKIQQV